jgi:hypothetical protein
MHTWHRLEGAILAVHLLLGEGLVLNELGKTTIHNLSSLVRKRWLIITTDSLLHAKMRRVLISQDILDF